MALNNIIYFDHNATTPLLKKVKEAMDEVAYLPLNPSSVHAYGRYAKKILEDARREVAKAAGISDQYKIVFTASGTEANNLAIKGLSRYKPITTTIEHYSVLKVIGEGIIPVDNNGIVNLKILEEILATSEQPLLVSVIAASNEIGVIEPIKEIVRLAHRYQAIVHTDASQALGKIALDIADSDADMVTLCAHKFGGPKGVGALVFKRNLPLHPIIEGGGQEYRFRSGTHNLSAIHGFGAACSITKELISSYQETSKLRGFLEASVLQISKDSRVFGKDTARLPNVSSLSMPNVSNETQVIHFDLNGIAVSTGSACSSGKVELPYVHMALGYDEKEASSAIRVSLGPTNTLDEVKKFIKVWQELYLKINLSAAA